MKCVKKNGDAIFEIKEFRKYGKPEKFNKKIIKAALKAGCDNYIYEYLGLMKANLFGIFLQVKKGKCLINIMIVKLNRIKSIF